jgi:hypothetical protein
MGSATAQRVIEPDAIEAGRFYSSRPRSEFGSGKKASVRVVDREHEAEPHERAC